VALPSGEPDQCEPEGHDDEKGGGKPIYEAETIRVGVMMDPPNMHAAHEEEDDEEETGPSHPP